MCVYHYDYDRRKKVITVRGFLSSSLNSFNTKLGIELGPVAFHSSIKRNNNIAYFFFVAGLRRNEVKY